MSEEQRIKKGRIEGLPDEGMVNMVLPTDTGGGFSARLTPEQAEVMAQSMLVAAYVARGGTPGERQFRKVREFKLR